MSCRFNGRPIVPMWLGMHLTSRTMERSGARTATGSGFEGRADTGKIPRRRINAYCLVTTVLIGVIVVLSASVSGTGQEISTGGDFPSFYAAGSIVADGLDSGSLYDSGVQADYEQPLIGPDATFLPFSYPAQFAVAYAPLSMLPYRISAGLGSALMVLAVIAAVFLVRPMVPVIDEWVGVAAMVAVGFFPLTWSLVIGQNVALTLVLFAWVWRSLHHGDEVAAGVAVALMMFRPQYGIPLLGLLLVGRHFRAVGAAAAAMTAIWSATSLVVGWAWVGDWAGFAAGFVAGDGADRSVYLVSSLGFLRAVFGEDSSMAIVFGVAVSISAAAALALMWNARAVPLDLLMASTAAGVVLISPHSGGFAPSLLLIWLAVAVDRDRSLRSLVPLALVLGYVVVWMPGALAGGSLGAVLVAVVFVVSLRQAVCAVRAGVDDSVGHESADDDSMGSGLTVLL